MEAGTPRNRFVYLLDGSKWLWSFMPPINGHNMWDNANKSVPGNAPKESWKVKPRRCDNANEGRGSYSPLTWLVVGRALHDNVDLALLFPLSPSFTS